MKSFRLACGCRIDAADHLIEMCPPCEAAHTERHDRAAADRLRDIEARAARSMDMTFFKPQAE
jgi:hypothetical protein